MQNQSAWYIGINGNQQGPMPTDQVVAGIQGGTIPETAYAFTTGMANWTPIKQIPTFTPYFGGGAPVPPMPMPTQPASIDEIDFNILGEELQMVEIELDPGEAAMSEAGAMLFMEQDITIETDFGDGGNQDQGLVDKAMAAGKRALTGESLALTVFRNNSTTAKRKVAFASPYPGKIIPMDLGQYGGKMICQKDAFLCAAKGIRVGIEFQRKIGVGLFGGEGFILQKLEGDGLAFVHAGGCIVPRTLAEGEELRLDTGCVVAFQPSIAYDIEFIGGIANALFGGEGLFLAKLKGPGTVWIQSLPFSRLAGRIYAAAPQTGGARVGEGSVLGGIGDAAMGSVTPQAPGMNLNSVLNMAGGGRGGAGAAGMGGILGGIAGAMMGGGGRQPQQGGGGIAGMAQQVLQGGQGNQGGGQSGNQGQ